METMESITKDGYFPIKTLRNGEILMVRREEMEINHYSHPQNRRADVMIATPHGKKNGGRFVYIDYSPDSKTPEVTVKQVRAKATS